MVSTEPFNKNLKFISTIKYNNIEELYFEPELIID